jgi:hypothetical protein
MALPTLVTDEEQVSSLRELLLDASSSAPDPSPGTLGPHSRATSTA